MGLSESKAPFEADCAPSTPQVDKEIGICQILDPRSPSNDFERTPIYCRNESHKVREEEIGVQVKDPRSPSNGITRTPIVVQDSDTTTTEVKDDLENELRAQIQRLKLFGTPVADSMDNSENLFSDKEIINSEKAVLELLRDEPVSLSDEMDSICSPNTTPRPRSRSTPKEISLPVTPASCKEDTDGLIKKKRSRGKRQGSQQKKLQKAVLKKSFMEQAPRSPLAERNGENVIDKRINAKMRAKPTTFVKYRKYNTLDESFTGESFAGKENEDIVW